MKRYVFAVHAPVSCEVAIKAPDFGEACKTLERLLFAAGMPPTGVAYNYVVGSEAAV